MSFFYHEGIEGLLARTIPASAGFRVIGVNQDYVPDADHSLSSIASDTILLDEQPIGSVTFTNGILDGDDIKWFAVQAPTDENVSPIIIGVVIYLEWNGGADSALVAFIDSVDAGLPATVNGTDITAKWNDAGIFKL